MNLFTGYLITEKLYESTGSLIYRGRRQSGQQPVILKTLNQTYPSPEQTARFIQEYEITRRLNGDGVIGVYGLERHQHNVVMILEDFGATSLKQCMTERKMPLLLILTLAIQLSDILQRIHQLHVIHKDINPNNVLFNLDTQQVKLIDFGIATVLLEEKQAFRSPGRIEGTLPYISPEQTGRMNRDVDYRSDFYSLGVTLYELLTGQPPFSGDAMAIIHGHIAYQPAPPHEVNSEIPPTLSNIVMKTLAKNAEDRYQTSAGLKADLEECHYQLQTTAMIAPFPLGQRDISGRFQISQKLYGRDEEVNTLLTAFDRASQGRSELMLVCGQPGIGKTALVQEIHKPVTKRRGYFVTGKFSQLQRNTPYMAIIQAFTELIQQLLTESESQITRWRERLLVAFGPNGQILTDIIPELELITGPQPEVPALPPTEAQNRFNLVFQNFIGLFTRLEHPLVLFLDDLQWADNASLKLIASLITQTDNQYLFMIGAYRDNEVHPTHPLIMTLDEITKSGGIIHTILLSSLTLSHTSQLVADSLNSSTEQAKGLADLVLAKTGGNSFFIKEFLKSLYIEKLLTFRTSHNRWAWNLTQIQAQSITNNVVDLLVGRMRQLSTETQQVLQMAACIGSQFDLPTLAILYEKPLHTTALALWEALAAGMVIPLDNTYQLTTQNVAGLAETVTSEYKFAHDRVQQAVYSLIPDKQKNLLHWQIGQLWLQHTPAHKRESKIFDIVDQLNQGLSVDQLQSEQGKLIELNLEAGRKAKSAAAYTPAFNYLKIGLALAGETGWQEHYSLALALHINAAETAYLHGDFAHAEQLIQKVLTEAQTLLDKVAAYEIKIQIYNAQNKLVTAVETGLDILKLLGVEFPKDLSQEEVLRAHEALLAALEGKVIEDMFSLPEMTDSPTLAAMRVLSTISTATFFTSPDLYALNVFTRVALSCKYGNAPISAAAYAGYGVVLCGRMGNIDLGYQFGQLALRLLEKFHIKESRARTLVTTHTFTTHWKEHLRETLTPLLEAYQSGLETGDVAFASFSALNYCGNAYFVGDELTAVEHKIAKYSQIIEQLKQKTAFQRIKIYHQVILNLLGQAEDPCQLSGSAYKEEQMLPRHHEANDKIAIFMTHLNGLILCYLFHAYSPALDHSNMAEQYLAPIKSMAQIVIFYFYDSLVRLALYPTALASEQEQIIKKVAANQEKMELWAGHAPMNYRHKFYLVEAERTRVWGNHKDAREYYDQAITLARENAYRNEEALAQELAGFFYLNRGQSSLAHYYLSNAYYTYQQWGAIAKVKDLESRHPTLLIQPRTQSGFTVQTVASSIISGFYTSSGLDLTSVVKASQAISGEIDLDRLMAKLITIIIENAGAQRGCLVLAQGGELYLEVEGIIGQETPRMLQAVSIATAVNARGDPLIPTEIIYYVARTQEDVVLHDASREGRFMGIPYIHTQQPKSILCVPLANQGNLIGVIYLENNLMTGTFTVDRVEIVRLLGTQAAISITNAYAIAARAEQERLRLENQFLDKEAKELARLNADKDKFFSIVSHDLRGPFHSLLGFSHLLHLHLDRLTTADIQRMAESIYTSAESAHNLLENLLTWSQMQRGRIVCQPKDSSLHSLAERTVTLLRETAVNKQIRLVNNIDTNIVVYADPYMVDTVIRNLISNALKFTPPEGQVSISAQRTPPSSLVDNTIADTAFIEVSVSDTGTGISPENLDKLFRIDVHHTTPGTSDEQGTGLGLILCQEMVQKNGGHIRVESELGVGTAVKFTVPATGKMT